MSAPIHLSPTTAAFDLSGETLPVMYQVAGKVIPPRLTLQPRITYAHGVGLHMADARTIGVQDRASSLLAAMQDLARRSGNQDLFDSACRLVEAWNRECAEVFER